MSPRRKHKHFWLPKVYEKPGNIRANYGEAPRKIERPPADGSRVFVCKCGAETIVGGALSHENAARDDSYRPDLPLRSTDANVAKWADEIRERA